MPDRNGQSYHHLLTLFTIFYESDTETDTSDTDTNLSDYVLRLCNVHVLYCNVFNLCAKFELVKSPEMTLSG